VAKCINDSARKKEEEFSVLSSLYAFFRGLLCVLLSRASESRLKLKRSTLTGTGPVLFGQELFRTSDDNFAAALLDGSGAFPLFQQPADCEKAHVGEGSQILVPDINLHTGLKHMSCAGCDIGQGIGQPFPSCFRYKADMPLQRISQYSATQA
jgi:hypothetical protein